MSDVTKPLIVGSSVKVVNSSTMLGTIVETRVAHLVRITRTGQELWYSANDLEETPS